MSRGSTCGIATVYGIVDSVTVGGIYWPDDPEVTSFGKMTIASGATATNLKLGAGYFLYGVSSHYFATGNLDITSGGVVSGVEFALIGESTGSGSASQPVLHVYSGGAAYDVIASGLDIRVDPGGLITYAN